MRKQDWLLVAVNESQRDLTPVQLQKSLFLLGAERPDGVGRGFYKFKPFNYGPFDVTVYHDAADLALQGLVTISDSPDQMVRRYQVTPAGQAKAQKLAESANPEAYDYLKRAVAWVEGLTFRQLVEAIYRKYPEQRENSVFA